ncbi:uncharacterized protein [Magallana gigas]|uniref:uncharacterized protein n=1 Tax=Magallana gigas TaxID=29159 RepID=UPI003341EEA6
MEDKQDGDPKFKFVRKEEEKIKRRRREKLKRLSNKIREFMEEEPDVPVVFLHTLNGKTEGHVSPWLRDICGDFSTQMASASMAHHADMLLSAKEYKVPTAEEEWKNLLSLNAVETPEAILRKILPLILKGIVQGKNIWKGPRPEGWPASIPFQDPNRTINHRKLGAEDLRKIFNSFQVFHCIVSYVNFL